MMKKTLLSHPVKALALAVAEAGKQGLVVDIIVLWNTL